MVLEPYQEEFDHQGCRIDFGRRSAEPSGSRYAMPAKEQHFILTETNMYAVAKWTSKPITASMLNIKRFRDNLG